MWPFMPALHSSLRASLKNQIGFISFLSDERPVMSDPLGMFVPLDSQKGR
jgi:hypothetical protein